MRTYKKITDLIGNTPLLELESIEKNTGATVFGKLEYFNPAGSVKDRIAKAMIDDAEAKGILKPDSVIVEPTILTEGVKGMKGAIQKAQEIAAENARSFIPSQFTNNANPKAHYDTTGPEIWDDTDGRVDILVAGVGTGGTVSGVGEYLKTKNPNIQVVAVEPSGSPVLSGEKPGPHKIQGIGAGFVPETLNADVYDEVIKVTNEDAFTTGKALAKHEGLLVGISSGAAVWAAAQLAKRPENKGKIIVAILPDTGERYLSTPMFSE